ncbi:hypothetical protein ACU686_20740 [Yinghuangia aomiensis]
MPRDDYAETITVGLYQVTFRFNPDTGIRMVEITDHRGDEVAAARLTHYEADGLTDHLTDFRMAV